MKYMIMMFGDREAMVETQSSDWIREMIAFMGTLDQDLRNAGELVESRGLADPSQAKSVTFTNGAVAVTDGPYAESKESLAGYWVVDVADEPRALEIASRVVGFTHGPIEVRQVPDGPPPM